MFERIIQFAIEQRIIVMLAVLAMAGLGIASIVKEPVVTFEAVERKRPRG